MVLGRLGMEPEGREAPVHGLPGRRAELVFAYLAVEHARRVSRDELANALWPATLPDSWTAALRGVVSDVRRFLKDSGVDPAEVLATGRRGYQLRLPAQVVVDIDEARAASADAHIELAAGAPALAAAHAARAAALAQLPFLPRPGAASGSAACRPISARCTSRPWNSRHAPEPRRANYARR